MAKTARKQGRDEKRSPSFQPQQALQTQPEIRRAPPLEPKTELQRKYISAIRNSTITFGIGPAGTGKTYIAGALACEMLTNKSVEKIIITRPAVEAGESLGFLPGELEEKYEPYIAAFRDVLNERLGKSFVEYLMKMGRIEAMPFAYMRGRTFKNCIVILDEAQNATVEQMKLFLTRIGENCKVVIDGDETQSDIKNPGLMDAVKRVSFIPQVRVIHFTKQDVVRSGIVSEIVQAYEDVTSAPQRQAA